MMPNKTTYTYKEASGCRVELDVYVPSDASLKALPVLLWWHGGGLLMSNKENLGPHLTRAPDTHGMVVVSADYRLAPQVSVVDILEDVRDAVAWIREELPKKFPGLIDPARLAVSGGSAGGYLALLSGLPISGIVPPPSAVLAIYPITDFSGPFFTTPQRPVSYVADGSLVEKSDMAAFIDPNAPVVPNHAFPKPPPKGDRGNIYTYMVQEAILEELLFAKAPAGTDHTAYIPAKHVTKDYPPLYIWHGVVDQSVGIEQPRSLVPALDAAGVTYKYDEVPGPEAIHLFDIFRPHEEFPELYQWFKKYV